MKLITGILLLAASVTASAVPGFYQLTTKANNSLCLESNAPVAGASVGGASFMNTCQDVTGMWFKITPGKTSGEYTLQSMGGEADNRCMESNIPGFQQEVLSATFNDTCGANFTGQQWIFTRTGNNEYLFKTDFGGPDRCLEGEMDEIGGGNPANGAAGMDACDGGSDQTWQLIPAPFNSPSVDTDEDGIADAEEFNEGTDPLDPASPRYVNEAYYLNPASNVDRQSILRIINFDGNGPAAVTLSGIDDSGADAPFGDISLAVPAGGFIELTAIDLESGNAGKGLSGGFGNGSGKWRVRVSSNRMLHVMSILQTADGKITNAMATVPVIDDIHHILIGVGSSNNFQDSFIRFINLANSSGTVTIEGVMEDGFRAGSQAVLSLGPRQSQQLTVDDLEFGNPDKGLSGSLGATADTWRLEATPSSTVSLRIMNMMRTPDGFLTDLGASIPAVNTSSLTGRWQGEYTCAQGLTRLTLDIDAEDPFNIDAIFRFREHEDNPGVPSGSYSMEGSFDAATGVLELDATDWITQPTNFVSVDLTGLLSSHEERISGEVDSASCSSFSVVKDATL